MSISFEERFRTRIYKGWCDSCHRKSLIRVSASYDPLLGLANQITGYPHVETECLACGGSLLKLCPKQSKKMQIDIYDWKKRVDFTEKFKPYIIQKLEEGVEFDTEMSKRGCLK